MPLCSKLSFSALLALPLSALLALLLGCGGASSPPPPVAVGGASPGTSGLQPLSSRDGSDRAAASLPSAAPAGGAGASLPPGHPPLGTSDPHGNAVTGAAARSAGSVSGTIRLSPRLSIGPSDVLYLMAKKGSSTVAVRRTAQPKFPMPFEISGQDVMVAGAGFEGPLDLVARVSKSGDAIASKGDLEGTARNVAVPSQGVSLTIDRVRE